MTGNTMWPFAA